MTTSGSFLKMYVNVLQISQFLSCDYLYQYTRSYSSLVKYGKGVRGIWTFFKIILFANKTRPVNQKFFFFLMMIACYQTQQPANSGYRPISSSWDINSRRIIGVRERLLESDDVRVMPHFFLSNWSKIKNWRQLILWLNKWMRMSLKLFEIQNWSETIWNTIDTSMVIVSYETLIISE